jgi:hypothetical protein
MSQYRILLTVPHANVQRKAGDASSAALAHRLASALQHYSCDVRMLIAGSAGPMNSCPARIPDQHDLNREMDCCDYWRDWYMKLDDAIQWADAIVDVHSYGFDTPPDSWNVTGRPPWVLMLLPNQLQFQQHVAELPHGRVVRASRENAISVRSDAAGKAVCLVEFNSDMTRVTDGDMDQLCRYVNAIASQRIRGW